MRALTTLIYEISNKTDDGNSKLRDRRRGRKNDSHENIDNECHENNWNEKNPTTQLITKLADIDAQLAEIRKNMMAVGQNNDN